MPMYVSVCVCVCGSRASHTSPVPTYSQTQGLSTYTTHVQLHFSAFNYNETISIVQFMYMCVYRVPITISTSQTVFVIH